MQRLAAQGPTQALVPIIEVIYDLQTHKFYMIWPMIIVIDLQASSIFGKEKKINKMICKLYKCSLMTLELSFSWSAKKIIKNWQISRLELNIAIGQRVRY